MRQAFIRNTCTFFFAFALLPIAATAQPTVWVTDSLTRTGVSDSAGSTTWEQLSAAKGEYASFQIIVQAPYGGLGNVNVTMSNLTGPGGAVIPSTAFSLFREQYTVVQPGSVNWLGSNQPLGAGTYPDGLIPFTDPNTGAALQGAAIQAVPFTLGQSQNQPIWVDVLVPRNATSGSYTGTYTVSANQGSYTGYVTLNVWHFALPVNPYLRSSMVFWAADSVQAEEEILRNRLNPASSAPANQAALMAQGLETVAIKFDSGAHAGSCTMTGPPTVAQLEANKALQNPGLLMYDYSADEIAYCPSLFPLVQQWGYNLHQAGLKNLVTIAPTPALYDDGSGTGRSAVDIWTILPEAYDYDVSQMATVLAKGDSLWSYNALVQDAYSPKWEIDFAPINFRVQPGFINQSLNMTGLLYWRVDYWASDPWNWVNNTGQFSGNNYPGEGQLVYPGADVGIAGVAPSMRLKWLRDGSEDYDYIQLLKNAGYGSWAMNLVSTVGPNWTNWTRSNSVLENVRLQMGQMLDQIYGGSGSTPSQPQTTPSTPASGTEVAPTVTSIVPSNNGNRTTFTITINDANGSGDLAGANVMVNASYGGAYGCWFYYNLNSATVSLANDAGSAWTSVGQGSGSTISNSQCSIAGTDFGAARSGNSAVITIAVNFNSSFAGTKSLYVAAGDNENESSNYQNMGLWTVAGGSGAAASAPVSTPAAPPAPSAPTSSEVAPTVVSIVPSNNGTRTTFTITIADANGSNDLAGAGVIVNTGYNGANACWIYYNLNYSTVSLADNSGSTWASVSQGSGSTISNSQCSVAGTDFGAYRSGNTAVITVAVTANQGFAGTKTLYVAALDNENESSNYQNMGLWTVQ